MRQGNPHYGTVAVKNGSSTPSSAMKDDPTGNTTSAMKDATDDSFDEVKLG